MSEAHAGGSELRRMVDALREATPEVAADLELIQRELRPQYIVNERDECAMCALTRIARRLYSDLPDRKSPPKGSPGAINCPPCPPYRKAAS